MFESHFGLRESPFHSGHQMRFLYPSREHQEARAHLRFGIENREPFVLITGEVGTGKTTALYDALAEWGSKVSVALVTNSALSREEMIEEICLRFGLPLPPGASKPQSLALLEKHLLAVRNRGEHAVLLLDEAQNLAPELLEEIRLLSNMETQGEKLVQIFLVGQPELEAKLADPQLRQLRQRISVHYRLNPLSPEETAGYIHHRISVAGGNPWAAFPPESCREVYRVTHGIPREINTVATQAMIAAFTENESSVSRAHVQAVAQENDFHSVLGGPLDLPEEEAPSPAPPAAAPDAEPAAPAADAPAWSPPELAPPAPAASGKRPVDPALREELDAWSRAAFGVLEARRKRAADQESTVRAQEPAAPAPARTPEPVWLNPEPVERAPAPAAHAQEPRFPSHAELRARAERANPASADLSGLPARLREKIVDDIAREERAHHATPIVLAAVATAAIAVGLVLAQRFQVIDIPFLRPLVGMANAARPASTPAVVPPAAPVAATSPHDTMRALAAAPRRPHVGTQASTTAVPASVPSAAATAPVVTETHPQGSIPDSAVALTELSAPAATTPKNATVTASGDTLVFGIGVGSYLDRDRAREQRDVLCAKSGLPGQVIAFISEGTTMYRIVLGRYPSNAAATRAASEFVEKYGVDEATPLLLSRTRPR